MIREFRGKRPRVGEGCYIDDSAVVIGDVEIGANCSVWPQVVIRGDINVIRIGDDSNIQDGSVLHVTHRGPYGDGAGLFIGNRVTVGHMAMLHGCTIGDECLVGMGAIVTDDVVVERQVIIGSGSMVPPGKRLESGHLYFGNPVQKRRPLSGREIEYLGYVAEHYVLLQRDYRGEQA